MCPICEGRGLVECDIFKSSDGIIFGFVGQCDVCKGLGEIGRVLYECSEGEPEEDVAVRKLLFEVFNK